MAKTAVADVIIPTEFEKYAIEGTAGLSNFGDSGIIEMAPEFDTLAQGGGREVKMPFWKDLTATRQLLSDSVVDSNDATTFRVAGLPDRLPRVETPPPAPAFQPWAGGLNPFGIGARQESVQCLVFSFQPRQC